jgi:adenosylmethionine-8-amino-7-oxononanoate aminotransferase
MKNLRQRDAQVMWHPYTQMKLSPFSIAVESARGIWLYGEDGSKYIDAISSWWVNIHGHCHPHIVKAIQQQVEKLEQVIFAGFTHEPAVRLAEALLPLLPPNQKKIFLSDNGSTAVEAALKMSLQYHANQGKEKYIIIAFKDAYHGDTFGSMSVSARGVFTEPFHRLLFDVIFIDTPNEENHEHVLNQFQQALDKHKDNLCAFIFEPLVLGSGGMLMYSAEILNQLMGMAKAENILCIADEVMTGFGRTGKMFASEFLAHPPDIICLSKGITGGFLPLGATSCTQEIYDAFWSDDKKKMLFHGHSYTGNALACAAAVASLEVWHLENTLEKVRSIIRLNQNFINRLRHLPKVKRARMQGTITAFEVQTNENNYLNPVKEKLMEFYLNRGVLLRPLGNTVYTLPPYCITEKELKQVFSTIEDSLEVI